MLSKEEGDELRYWRWKDVFLYLYGITIEEAAAMSKQTQDPIGQAAELE